MSEIEPGFTASENLPGQAQSRASKLLLDDLLAARQAHPDTDWQVADPEPVAWEAMYRDLLEEKTEALKPDGSTKLVPRWDWRKALYIAWNCVPTSKRWPKHEVQLIELLGLANTATIRKWKASDPEIEQRIAAGPKKLLGDHIADVLEALVKVATQNDAKAHQDRKLFLEMTGQYKPRGALEMMGEDGGPIEYREADELSDDELARIAAAGRSGVTAPAAGA